VGRELRAGADAVTRPTLRAAAAEERPLVTPLAHDALSARLIERAGFRAFAVGGSALLAARHALPDLGLVGLADMTAGIRDLAAATRLPFMADGDDGYGDVKAVVRMVQAYEALEVGGVLIEDQERSRKQQRADRARGVVDEAVIEQKLRAAVAARSGGTMLVIGRTDAFGLLGLDAALRRAERFLRAGADGVFVAGLRSPEDHARVGRALRGTFLSAAMFEDGATWLSPRELGEMGFTQVSFPASLIFRAVEAMSAALAALREHARGTRALAPMAGSGEARRVLDEALDVGRWRAIEAEFEGG
jgi:2-methylisocitrate lyase-like PEP mutase family enzyme